MRLVRWSDHARWKLELLAAHGVTLDPAAVENIVRNPNKLEPGYKGRVIAQGDLDAAHVLRIVYEDSGDALTISTVYPGRRERYEKASV